MVKYKKGQLVYWYNMWTKRKSKLRIVKYLGKSKYKVEYPGGEAFGKHSVYEGDLSKRKKVESFYKLKFEGE